MSMNQSLNIHNFSEFYYADNVIQEDVKLLLHCQEKNCYISLVYKTYIMSFSYVYIL